ncbi:serine hydrolase domain-containing protein [Sphingomonas sp.]|uniref:serine hydrolase domain-containing protein n=1 Tax=Sphingomonas sp. TaxID=28214 RepID=UPI001B0C52F5|nr:serine hydrolase domain-containing protein [Sphingomonas sp.]MBO9711618.1 serine hydrolase [Sphingomonas sp.]
MRRWKRAAAAVAAVLGLAGAATGQLAKKPDVLSPPVAPAATTATVPAGGARPLEKTDLDAWLDGFMPNALRGGDLAGAVVVVVKDGQVMTARGFGYADVAKKTPVDPYKTLFRPGSVSKLVTWTAVMQQVEAGKINLDADINTYLDFKIPPRGGQPITMRQIMTHTAGFEEAIKDLIGYDGSKVMPIDAYLKRWTPHRIFDAGTTPAYSNWATTLAGYVVQRVSGMKFDDYVDQRIFAPLQMQYATFRQPLPKQLAPYMAQGYPKASEPAKPFEIVQPAPAGSLSASGVDMAKFMIAHLNNGAGLLRPETAAMMHDSPLDKVNPRSLIPPLNRMELGFFETNINGREVIAHLGDTENFHTSLHLFMKEGVGFYVSFNSAGHEGAAHQVRLDLFRDFADRYFPSTEKDGKVDDKTAAEHARLMVGLWESSRKPSSNFLDVINLIGQTTVTVDAHGKLLIPSLKGANHAPVVWDEIAPFVWREHGGHDRLAAQVVDGKVVRWSYDLPAPFTVWDRVPFGRSGAWILPLLYASLAVLALALLYWPVAAFTRWRFGAKLALEGNAKRAYRATGIMAGLVLAMLLSWIIVVQSLFGNLSSLTSTADVLLWACQIGGAIIFVGAVGITGWNAWLSWRDGRSWPRKIWNTLVCLATLQVLYVASTFGLLSMTVNY